MRRDAIDIYDHIDVQELRSSYLAHVPQLGIKHRQASHVDLRGYLPSSPCDDLEAGNREICLEYRPSWAIPDRQGRKATLKGLFARPLIRKHPQATWLFPRLWQWHA